jgi:hypothetical protein
VRKDGWEPCPRCGSNRVQQRGKGFFFLLFVCMAGFISLLGIFFLPLFILGGILALFSPIAFLLPKMNQCQDCKYSWKVNKEKGVQAQ